MTAHAGQHREPDEAAGVASGRKPADAADLAATVRRLVSETCGIPADDLDDSRPLAEYGLTSRDSVALSGHLEQVLGRPLPATLLWENPTVERLAHALAADRPCEPEDGLSSPDPAHGAGASAPDNCSIAVIGLGCRLPAGIDGPDVFWKHLLDGSDLVGHVPDRRWRDFATGPTASLLEHTTRRGAFLDDVDAFDADYFGITPREAEVMDPQQRLLLEVGCEALDNAGSPANTLQGSNTGVFVGLSSLEYGHLTTADPARLTPWTSTGAAGSIAANRLSYLFDLHGPSLTVDTACSSSLVAVHQACQSLRNGECDMALAGGVNVLLSPAVTASFQQAGALAADGRCKPFDAAADGITRGEGCGVVVLKRLADARRDGDRILAVVKGSAVNSDGRSAGLMAPNPAAQEALLRRALDDACVQAAGIDYVEAHGTGTLLGDPMEAGSLGTVVGSGKSADQPLLIGSVKSNLGHLEGAAGIVGLIKTVLALYHGRIPATLHFRSPNPHIDFSGLRLRVVTAPTAWPARQDRPARAGVSAFGFGGTNAHVIVEQAPRGVADTAPRTPAEGQAEAADTPHVLVVSARSRERIGDSADSLARWIAADDAPALTDAAHTLARHRRGPVCAAVVARTRPEAVARLAALARGEQVAGLVPAGAGRAAATSSGPRGPVFVFSGYGSQWHGMGQRLLKDDPMFAAAVRELDPVYTAQTGTSLEEMIARPEPGAGVHHTQPLIFGMQVALAGALRAYGLRPAAVIGHSMGEVSAAVVARALDVADGLHIMLRRSAELATIDGERAGAMAAVELPHHERAQTLAHFPDVEVAVHSSPRRCTVAGPAEAVRSLVDDLTGQGKFARLLDVGGAGHSSAVDPVLFRLQEALAGVRPRPAQTPWYSTVLDDPRADVHADAGYWCANARRPVRFHQAVAAAAADGHDVFLEVSPHPIAAVPLGETLQEAASAEAAVIPVLHRNSDEALDLRIAVVRSHLAGVPIDEDLLWPRGARTALPTPPWRHERYWFNRRSLPAATGSNHLLGVRSDDPRTGAVLWQTDLGSDGVLPPRRFLHDRPVLDLPAATALMLAAAQEAREHGRTCEVRMEDVRIHRWLPLSSRTPVTVVWEPVGTDATVTINSRSVDGTWHCLASARLPSCPGSADDRMPDMPATGVSRWRPAAVEEPAQQPAYEELLAAALQAPADSAGAAAGGERAGTLPTSGETVPVAVESLHLRGFTVADAEYDIRCFANQRTPEGGDRSRHWDIMASGENVRITAHGVELQATERREVPKSLEALTYDIQWQKSPVPLPRPLERVLLLTDVPATGGNDVCTALSAALEAKSVRVSTGSCRAGAAASSHVLESWLDNTATEETSAVVLLLTRSAESPEDTGTLKTVTRITRLLTSCRTEGPMPRLWMVTTGARATSPGEFGEPHMACLRGLVRVLAVEKPALRACLVDIDNQPDTVDGLVHEVLGDGADDEVAWRAGSRLVARLDRADLTAQQYETPFARPDGAYLITGGLTGLGLATACRLAAQGAGHLVLNGRRPPGVEAQAVLDRLRADGTLVTVVQGDIADSDVAPRMVEAALAEGHLPRGVAHCAGVLHDRMITDLEDADVDIVLRPKVIGALCLEDAVAHHDLDWWVTYSSAAALLGSPGQAVYAAANAWLDAIAHRRRAQGLPAVSIAWGPWGDVGAAPASNPALALEPLTTCEGLDALQTLVAHKRVHVGVVHFDAQRIVEAFPGVADLAYFADSLRDTAGFTDDWAGPDAIEILGNCAADKVYARLVKRTAAIMGFSAADLSESVPLTELGLDSLMTVRIRNAARQDFAVDIPADLMLRGATLRDVGDTVLDSLGLTSGAAGPDASRTRCDTDAAATPAPVRGASPPLPRSIQPRDAAERLLAGVWVQVLGRPPADVHADFAADGGDPPAAQALVDAVRERLGGSPVHLTAEAVLAQRTVAAIAELIRPAVNPTGESLVSVLRPPGPNSSRLPLFTFHPAGGPTSVYLPLTQLLSADRAVYGLERLDAVTTMEDKAAHYLSLIRDLQPVGPYQLLGWSFGGCLAYEAARQLKDAGQSVGFVGLIDTILPAALPDLDSQQMLLERFGRFADYIEQTYGRRLDLPYEELAATPDDQQIDVVMRLVAEAGLDMSPGIMEHQRTSYVDARVGERYVPRPYDGPVVLYRAQRAQTLTTALDPRYLRSEADLGWAPLCPLLEVVPVDGDHLSLIDPPHVATIARHLTQALGEVST
ncbi:SDR family NAD(P)-dependent oxidoreductase [Streptomyces sp. V1I6]|uniref:SDR family NAD(P)-dependent oxidoreductase n=1 Tax=Streptomyces sp. V1I6 TaxID=3042273 RepID=UPI00277E2D8C|nr:SDR family NAD(P)-dependent oxidoreductase [Streptomyces sp. V1I6]MDQ0846321.1 phthiocerol/phenolphthiocerol synthesis type-I polyketide synthase D [Streptomyces sp. V1I6]